MEKHEGQQFDFFLGAAIERFVERIEQRCGGPVPALHALRNSPNGHGVWLEEFVEALFQDFLLDNPAGSAFVVQALARRPVPQSLDTHGDVATVLARMARSVFSDLLRIKSEQALEQRLAFQVTD